MPASVGLVESLYRSEKFSRRADLGVRRTVIEDGPYYSVGVSISLFSSLALSPRFLCSLCLLLQAVL